MAFTCHDSHCLLGIVSSGVFNQGVQVCLACVNNTWRLALGFSLLFLFFHPSVACFCFMCCFYYHHLNLFNVFSWALFTFLIFYFMLALVFLWLWFNRFLWLTSCFGFASAGFIGCTCFTEFFLELCSIGKLHHLNVSQI